MWNTSNGPDGASWWLSWDLWGGRWYVTKRLQLSNVCAYFKFLVFSLLLDDHKIFQSMRVMKHIHLRFFDVRKDPGWWEGRIRYGHDICYRCRLSMCALLHKSPFSMYFTPSKVSRLSMVNTLLIGL